jgi:hypothetical protein
MPGRMKAGLWALRFLTRVIILLALLNLVGFLNTDNIGALIPAFVVAGAILLLAFMFACLWGISRGRRIAALLALSQL